MPCLEERSAELATGRSRRGRSGCGGLGVSAAIAAAAIPKDNRAEAIKSDLFMGSPAKGLTSEPKNTPDRREFIRDEDHFTKPWADALPRAADDRQR